MNIYRHSFKAKCPNNGAMIDYLLLISSERMIMVEDIQRHTAIDSGYHEAIADQLHAALGGRQRLLARHHGTDIETVRP